ncbi:hypothetical protein [Haloprofundus marisrubri]|uniref:hypothetical protein n=1 Tax=Haloprofundus marisrubri TaxID=1514971 RepID=UPI0012BB09B0|nr:hypothetical protein [Haloprofundus marisrubri]
MKDDISSPVLDRVFDVLRRSPRRQLLLRIHASGSDGVLREDITHSDATETSLHHNHLPMLEDYGYVDISADAEVFYEGDDFHELVPYLDTLSEEASDTVA